MSAPTGIPMRVYRALLHLYPSDFRAEYGREMLLLFRDQWRGDDAGAPGAWVALLWDVARSAPALHVEAWRARGSETAPTLEVTMKIAAMLAMLLGLYGALSALAEGVMVARGTIEGPYLLAVASAMLAGASLLAAGVVLLRRTPAAGRQASVAALVSLATILIARQLFPWMSVFSQLVGIGLPIALLIALRWSGSRSRPSAV